MRTTRTGSENGYRETCWRPSCPTGNSASAAVFPCWSKLILRRTALEVIEKQRLGGSLPVLELPTDRPRPVVQSDRGARQRLMLPFPLSEAIKALSRQEGVTLS
jgi:hypothetical protein